MRLSNGSASPTWRAGVPQPCPAGSSSGVALARALVRQPGVLLADEPTGALDAGTGRAVVELLRSLTDDGRTLIMVTHDQEYAAMLDRTVRLDSGHLEPELLPGRV